MDTPRVLHHTWNRSVRGVGGQQREQSQNPQIKKDFKIKRMNATTTVRGNTFFKSHFIQKKMLMFPPP